MYFCPGASDSSSVPWGQPWPGAPEGSGPDAARCSPASSAKGAQPTPALGPPEQCGEGRSRPWPRGAQRASALLRPETRAREESAPPSATNGTSLQTRMKVYLSGFWGARDWVLSGPRNWQRRSARSGWGKDGSLPGSGSSGGPLHSCWGPPTPSATRPCPDSITLSPKQGCLVSAMVGSTQLPPPFSCPGSRQ